MPQDPQFGKKPKPTFYVATISKGTNLSLGLFVEAGHFDCNHFMKLLFLSFPDNSISTSEEMDIEK